ncbi:MAG: hypothetical protein IH942_03870 [Acidobacteria bacterium]|nr:hypothetical protein [Acidobacteriota bacterium]
MIHLMVALWLTAIGVVAVAPAANWLTPFGVGAVAPAVGSAIYVVVGALLAAMDSFGVISALSASTIVAAVVSAVILRAPSIRIDARRLAAGTLIATSLAASVSVLALNIHATRLTNDSFGYLRAASSLEQTGGLEALDNLQLVKQQLTVSLIQATGWVDGTGYSPVLSPLFGATTLAAIGWLAIRVMKRDRVPTRWQVALLAAAGALLLTTNRFVYNLTYVNGHLFLAMLLLIAVGLSWLAVTEGEHRFLYIAGIAFAAVAITRAESLMVIALFMIPIISTQQLTLRDRLVVTLPTAIVSATWFGLVLRPHLPGSGVGFTPLFGNVAIAVLLAVFASIAGVPRLRRVVRMAPWLTLGGAFLLLAYHIQSDPQLLLTSMNSMAVNAAYWGFWGFFWYIIPPLLIATIVIGNVDEDRLWNLGIAGFFLTLPLTGYLRGSAFRVGSGDSANRMLMHVVPLLILYLLLAAGRASINGNRQDDAPAATDAVAESAD